MTVGPADFAEPTGRLPTPRWIATAIALSFVVIMAGTQLVNPLLPLYGAALDLEPSALAGAYSVFLVALVPALLVGSRRAVQARPAALVFTALGIAIVADVVLLGATVPSLFIGRLLNGIALGLGAGATATLGLALIGERARTIAATSTILGAVVGTIGTILIADFLPDPLHLVYVVHGVLAVLAVALMAAGLNRMRGRTPRLDQPVSDAASPLATPPKAVGFILGAAAWTSGAIVVAFVPLAVLATFPGAGFLLANTNIVCMLVFACIAQYAFVGVTVRAATYLGYSTIIAGLVLVAFALTIGDVVVLLVGCALAGVGQGIGYRTGLLIVSVGLAPRAQGSRTSVYACIAYGTCAAIVVITGLLVTATAFSTGLWIVAATVTPVGLACLAATLVGASRARAA